VLAPIQHPDVLSHPRTEPSGQVIDTTILTGKGALNMKFLDPLYLCLFSMAHNLVTAVALPALIDKPISQELMSVNISGSDLRDLNCWIRHPVLKELRRRFSGCVRL
jgi:hypothetical protein